MPQVWEAITGSAAAVLIVAIICVTVLIYQRHSGY